MRTPNRKTAADAAKKAFWGALLAPSHAPPSGAVSLGRRHGSNEHIPLDPELRTHHLYVIGQTGTRKTTLLRNLIAQDLAAGHGLAVLSPDDEMFRDHLLPSIPPERVTDVVYIDPADTEHPIPLNPLHLAANEDLHEKVDETLAAFLRIVEGQADAAGAHRMERILYAAIHTLTAIPGHTLLDIPRLLRRNDAGEKFRTWAARQLSDEPTRAFWTEDYPTFPKDAHQAVLNRLHKLLTPPVRALLCTPGACLNFRDAMDSKKILLCRLTAKACKGRRNAALVGQLIVANLKLAALSREDIPEEERRRNLGRYFFPIFIDEFQQYCGTSADDYQEMFSRTRKYLAPVHLAHLDTWEIPEALMHHILTVVSTLVVFRTGASDARRLCREMVYKTSDSGGRELRNLDPNSVVFLPNGRAYCKVRGEVLLVDMHPPPPRGNPDIAQQVVARSRSTYGAGQSPVAPSADQPFLDDIDPKQVF